MALYDSDWTINHTIGTLYDNDWTVNHTIGTLYDNDWTTNHLIFSRETQVYPGVGMNYFNTGTLQSYGTCTNNGSTVHIETFGGTDTGGITCYIGPFNAVGKTKIMFNLVRNVSIDTQHYFVIGIATNNQSSSTSGWQVLNTSSYGATGGITWTKSNVWSIVNPSSSMWLGVAQTSSNNYSGHTLIIDITGIWIAA